MGAHYQVTDGVVTKYYDGGAFRVGGTLYYGLTDHLGSTSMTIDAGGSKIAEMRYTAWGEVRFASGSTPTDRSYAIPVGGTGQRSYTDDFGLMFYNARWYDPSLGRFAQADTIVPGGVQGLDRYAYTNNNPVKYTDPTGHDVCSNVPLMWQQTCYSSNGRNDFAQRVQETITNLLESIAKSHNIHLSPNDHWEYSNDLHEFIGGVLRPMGGYTPRYPGPGEFVYDKNGDTFIADDTAVYIGNGALLLCNNNTECIAAIMAHEAVHSTIEYLIDPKNTNSLDARLRQKEETMIWEERYAATLIKNSGKIGEEGATMVNRMYNNSSCPCDHQDTIFLAQAYSINLSTDMILGLIFQEPSP